MDITNYTTEHRKGQHLLSEERHEIEVRLKDGWSIYRVLKNKPCKCNSLVNSSTLKKQQNKATLRSDLNAVCRITR